MLILSKFRPFFSPRVTRGKPAGEFFRPPSLLPLHSESRTGLRGQIRIRHHSLTPMRHSLGRADARFNGGKRKRGWRDGACPATAVMSPSICSVCGRRHGGPPNFMRRLALRGTRRATGEARLQGSPCCPSTGRAPSGSPLATAPTGGRRRRCRRSGGRRARRGGGRGNRPGEGVHRG